MNFPSLTQHCVIEEQEDHLVIAIRIPKAEIAANIHLLAGLVCSVPRIAGESTAELG